MSMRPSSRLLGEGAQDLLLALGQAACSEACVAELLQSCSASAAQRLLPETGWFGVGCPGIAEVLAQGREGKPHCSEAHTGDTFILVQLGHPGVSGWCNLQEGSMGWPGAEMGTGVQGTVTLRWSCCAPQCPPWA